MQRESANGDSSHCVNNPRPLRNSLEIRATRSVRGSRSLAGTGDSVTTNFRSADHGSGPGTHRVGQSDSHDVVGARVAEAPMCPGTPMRRTKMRSEDPRG